MRSRADVLGGQCSMNAPVTPPTHRENERFNLNNPTRAKTSSIPTAPPHQPQHGQKKGDRVGHVCLACTERRASIEGLARGRDKQECTDNTSTLKKRQPFITHHFIVKSEKMTQLWSKAAKIQPVTRPVPSSTDSSPSPVVARDTPRFALSSSPS